MRQRPDPLHYAMEAGNTETRQVLMIRARRSTSHWPPFWRWRIVWRSCWIKTPPWPTTDPRVGRLEWAAWGGNLEIARLLVSRGADINEPAAGFAAASNGSVALLRFLLEGGMDPNSRWRGRTLLHAAVEMRFSQDNTEIVDLLIVQGAQVNALNDAGATPLDIAVEKGGDGKFTLNPHETRNERRQYDRIAALLQEHGGKRSREFTA